MAYKMTHPETDLTVEVEADQVATYESQGWETAKTVKSPAAPEQKAV